MKTGTKDRPNFFITAMDKDQTVIISLHDMKDNQENHYGNSGIQNGGNVRGYHRKSTYYNNHHHRYNNNRYRQNNHIGYHYNNSNGYNNNHGGGGSHMEPNNGSRNYSYDHHFQPGNHRYIRRDHQPGDMYSPQGPISYPHFFQPPYDQQQHLHASAPLNPLYTPGPPFVFPEIQIPSVDASKLPDQCRGIEWMYDGDGITSDGISPPSESPNSMVQNNSGVYSGPITAKKRVERSNGSPTPGQYGRISPVHLYGNPYYHGGGRQWENRWNWSQSFPIEEMIEKYHYVEDSERPDLLTSVGHQLEKLSDQIWTKFQTNQQTLETFRKKLDLWKQLSDSVKKYNSSFSLEMVGSTLSGYGSNTSDVDMCLTIGHRNEVDPRQEAIDLLEALCPTFLALADVTRKELILAKVPILKLHESTHGIDIDVNVNNAVGLRNTHLLSVYGQCDWRVRPLVLVVKLWAQAHGINDAKSMTLSSYSLALMVIHYMQCGVSPQIIPCLQRDHSDRFAGNIDIWRVKKLMMEPIVTPKTENTQSLGELLVGFLEYFATKFDYRNSAISVRVGSSISARACSMYRAPKNDAFQWKHICIEEPFEHTNTARSVFEKESYDRIRGVFIISWQRIVNSHDLGDIFQPISIGEARSVGARAK